MSTDPTPAAMPSEGELFRQAMDTPSPAPSEPPPPSPPSTPPTDERPRDELGRFAPMGEEPAAPPPGAPPAPPAPPPSPAPQVTPPGEPPPWQRELVERLERSDAHNRQLQTVILEMQRANAAHQAQINPPPKPPEVPDVITDPQGFTAYVTDLIQNERRATAEQMRNQEANFSFRIAHEREGELFEHAYTTMVSLAERGDPSVVRQVLASPDPGMAMMNWYKRARSLSTVGDDPDRYYLDRLANEAKDPKRAGEILEIIRSATAQATPPGAPPAVQLPPSLSRIPSTQASVPGANGMPSDNELWNYAFRQGR